MSRFMPAHGELARLTISIVSFAKSVMPAVVFEAEDEAARAGELGAALHRLDREADRLLERGAFRLVAAEDAHVRRAELLRDVQPLARAR